MVTGDNINTAKAIAKECGIYDPDYGVALEGPDFRAMSPAQVCAGEHTTKVHVLRSEASVIRPLANLTPALVEVHTKPATTRCPCGAYPGSDARQARRRPHETQGSKSYATQGLPFLRDV